MVLWIGGFNPLGTDAISGELNSLTISGVLPDPPSAVPEVSATGSLAAIASLLGMSSNIRFHQLRHSRITEVARKGLNQAQIMMVSGHRVKRTAIMGHRNGCDLAQL